MEEIERFVLDYRMYGMLDVRGREKIILERKTYYKVKESELDTFKNKLRQKEYRRASDDGKVVIYF